MSMELALLLVILGLGSYAALSVYLGAKQKQVQKAFEAKKSYKILEVRVSKHGENHFKDIEELFQSLSTLYRKLKRADKKEGRGQPRMSFEIVANKGAIRFFIRAEEGAIMNTIEHYLKGRYKQIELNEVERVPFVTSPTGGNAVMLGLAKPDILPLRSLKDYSEGKEFTDTLSSLMTSISTLQEGEGIWMQTVVEPENPKWSKEGEAVYKAIQAKQFAWAGKNQTKYILLSMHMPIWLKVVAFPFWVIGQLIKLGTGGAAKAKAEGQAGDKDGDKGEAALLASKMEKPILKVNSRILYGTSSTVVRAGLLGEVGQSFVTLGLPSTNTIAPKPLKMPFDRLLSMFEKREVASSQAMRLNTAELSMLWHPPTKFLNTPFINFLENNVEDTSIPDEEEAEGLGHGPEGVAQEADGNDTEEIPMESRPMLYKGASCLGIIDSFGKQTPFIIDDKDRRRHLYVIGQTGTGKSTFQQQMIISAIYKGQGVAVVDPHGELVDEIMKHIPSFRKNDVAYFDPSDLENPPAFNVLNVDKKGEEMLVTEILGIFHRMFENSWGPRMEQILFNALMGLVGAPNANLTDIPAFITTKEFRDECLEYCTHETVKYFWHDQFDVLEPRIQNESVVAVNNKVEKFLNNSIVRGVFGAKRNRFNFDFIMNKQKILLVNLSKGKLTPTNSEIIGSMVTSRLLVDAMKRVEIPEDERKDFFLFIDEFQNFVSSVKTFESILSEARKYRLNLNIAHQYIAQMPLELRAAIFGNVGTIISHRIGLEDAPVLVKQFGAQDVSEEMLTTLPPYTFYSRSVKNNKVTGVVKVKHLRPMEERFPALSDKQIQEIIDISKQQYTWNEEDRKAAEEKKVAIAEAKERQKQRERDKKNKKKKGPMIGPKLPPTKPGMLPGIPPEEQKAFLEAKKAQETGDSVKSDEQVIDKMSITNEQSVQKSEDSTQKPEKSEQKSHKDSSTIDKPKRQKQHKKPRRDAFITGDSGGVITPKAMFKRDPFKK